jgi:uncharacterized protein with ParB-like and HNH nuclease domain
MRIAFKKLTGEEIYLSPIKNSDEGNENVYDLVDDSGTRWIQLELINNRLDILQRNLDLEINESQEEIREKLDELVLELIEKEQSGTENTEVAEASVSPYDPDSIKVQTKPFNIKLIHDMIESGDIDLNPDFQRNFVWDSLQKSRLIESILLRIPLPMFYFSEDKEGLITVVDGLQRLTTIKEFMDNKFSLKGLEYLKDSCEGRYYSEKNKDGTPNNLNGIDPKYFRWFNMTQFTVNVIDPSSPAKVKYDIFRRINTGGKPLNNQEIRNCLASKNLRDILNEMTQLPEFKQATDYSIKSTRMEDQEVALRFICFYRYYAEDASLNNYNGNMEITLDDATEALNKLRKDDLKIYVNLFKRAMNNAKHLFGRYAFRKIMLRHLQPEANKQLINKALFVSWSVLLAPFETKEIESNYSTQLLAEPLANSIQNDKDLFNYLSYGTNGKANLQKAFEAAKTIIQQNLNNNG